MQQAITFLVVVFFSNLTGLYYGMYHAWWFDMLHHFLGGFFVAMLMTNYLADVVDLKIKIKNSKIKKYFILASTVAFIGVVWEFAEYLAAQTLIKPLYNNFGFRAYFIGDLDDTINDLLMDIMGALSWLILIIYRNRNKRN